jgi:glycosyltransferase involved in cell wall biosynthesis
MPIAPEAAWLDECLASLQSQTFPSWELVAVLDGGCTKNESSLQSAGLGDRLRVIRLPRGSGVARALNSGLENTEAEFVARMDADDVSAPRRLETQFEALVRRPSVWVLGTAARLMDSGGTDRGLRAVPSGSHSVRRTLAWRNALIHPSVLMRRTAILNIGGYNAGSDRMEDYELWLRVAAVGELDNLAEPLLHYRLHQTQHSRGRRVTQTAEIRRARRGMAGTATGRLRADARHVLWLGAQKARDTF